MTGAVRRVARAFWRRGLRTVFADAVIGTIWS